MRINFISKLNVKFIFNFLVCIVLYANPAFSYLFADIELVDFSHSTNQKHIRLNDSGKISAEIDKPLSLKCFVRLTFFNTDSQKFFSPGEEPEEELPGEISYFSYPESTTNLYSDARLDFQNWLTISCSHDKKGRRFKIDFSSFNESSPGLKTIRINGNINYSLANSELQEINFSDETHPNLKCFAVTQRPVSKQTLQGKFSLFQDRRKISRQFMNSFYYFFDSDNQWKYNMYSDFTTDERGKIGELAADISFQQLGFSKKNGKYPGNRAQGFDGVYTDNDILVLSESKFWSKPPVPDNIMNELKSKVDSRIQHIASLDSKKKNDTVNLIKEFSSEKRERVFLLVCITMDDGCVKYLIKNYQEPKIIIEDINITKFKNLIDSCSQEIILSFFEKMSLNLTESIKFLSTAKKKKELEIPALVIPDVAYNRNNLSKFLKFLITKNKDRIAIKHNQIIEKIYEKKSDLSENYKLKPTLSKLARFGKYPTFQLGTDHTDFWEVLKLSFPDEFRKCPW